MQMKLSLLIQFLKHLFGEQKILACRFSKVSPILVPTTTNQFRSALARQSNLKACNFTRSRPLRPAQPEMAASEKRERKCSLRWFLKLVTVKRSEWVRGGETVTSCFPCCCLLAYLPVFCFCCKIDLQFLAFATEKVQSNPKTLWLF